MNSEFSHGSLCLGAPVGIRAAQGIVRMHSQRERWKLLPALGAGPLRFGMSPAEVTEALQVSGLHERVGCPYAQEDFADGVKVFYDEGRWAHAWRWMPARRLPGGFCTRRS